MHLLVHKLTNKKNLFFIAYGLTLLATTSLSLTKNQSSFKVFNIKKFSSSNNKAKYNKSIEYSTKSQNYSDLKNNSDNNKSILNSFQNYFIF